ncbi:MAG: hypothetical protein JWQ38_2532, partial [Flavipsychrobacter sp.]|nr:hypothetical protein [Flavipsychrobacter sp.]
MNISRNLLLLFIVLPMSVVGFAQGSNKQGSSTDKGKCEKYDASMALGNRYLADDSCGMALRRFQDAQIAARQCNISGK